MNRSSRRSLATAIAFLGALCSAACAVPLAPAYRIVKESQEVRFVPGPPPELQVRAHFTLENSGNSELTFIDVIFPNERAYGRRGLRVEIDGRGITPVNLPWEYQQDQPNALRLPLDVPWQRKQRRELAVEYGFVSPEDAGGRITLSAESFHLGPGGWFPQPQPPRHALAPYPVRPRMSYTVRVPSDFLVLSDGARKGARKDGAETEYRFEVRSADLPPYVVAGHYSEWPQKRGERSTVFWTMQPLKEDAGAAAERIRGAWEILEKEFGPLGKNTAVPHVVESPTVRGHFVAEDGPAAASFPGGVLVNPAALSLGSTSERFVELVTHALARRWFDEEMAPAPQAVLGMGEGLPEYAVMVVEEARDGAAGRQRRVLRYLNEYDAAAKETPEKPLGAIAMSDPAAARRMGLAKAALFYAALEDACGPGPMRTGLAQMVARLRGRDTGYDALRSALEESSGRNLAELFRVWVNGKGIPKEFRERYAPHATGQGNTPWNF